MFCVSGYLGYIQELVLLTPLTDLRFQFRDLSRLGYFRSVALSGALLLVSCGDVS